MYSWGAEGAVRFHCHLSASIIGCPLSYYTSKVHQAYLYVYMIPAVSSALGPHDPRAFLQIEDVFVSAVRLRLRSIHDSIALQIMVLLPILVTL